MSDQALMSEKIDLIALALSKLQFEIENVNKDKTVVTQKFKYKYADLSSCIDVIKKSLRDNKMSISQLGSFDNNGKQILVTLLMHESGQWLKSIFYIHDNEESTTGNSLQKLGATLTYMRRYALSAIVGLTQEDDDAQSLTKNSNKVKENLIPSIAAEVRCLISEKKEQEAYALCESLAIPEKHKLWSLLNLEERETLKKIKEAA